MTRIVRGFGWTLIVSGAVVLLYVVYLLWFTNFETDRAQSDLAQTWALEVADQPIPVVDDDDDDDEQDAVEQPAPDEPDETEPEPDDPVHLGDAYAALWFERDGERIVNDDVLYVVEGVSLPLLRQGPGHYPGSDRPGGAGNFAVAGHRTTYGAPFWSVNELQDGDTIHVVDRQGREWTYAFAEQRIVGPQNVGVVYPDPLGTGAATITLTTCHPRGSARQRLIVFGELVEEPIESTAGGDPFEATLPGEA